MELISTKRESIKPILTGVRNIKERKSSIAKCPLINMCFPGGSASKNLVLKSETGIKCPRLGRDPSEKGYRLLPTQYSVKIL